MPRRSARRTPRIAARDHSDPEVAELLATTLHAEGRPLGVFTTMAWNPGVTRGVNRLGARLLGRSRLPVREREILILRVGWCAGSEYEFGQHTVVGREAGLDDDEIERLASEGLTGWSPREAALVATADQLCVDDDIDDATWTSLSEHFEDADLVEIVLLVGFYRMIAGFLNATGVPPEDAAPGWPTQRAEVSA